MRKLTASLVATLLVLTISLVGPAPEPAEAAVTCRTQGASVHRRSISTVGTLYRFSNTMRLCVESNRNFRTITSARSWPKAWDIDFSWSYKGLANNNSWNGHFGGLWTRHTSHKQGHFQQSWWFYQDNKYPYVTLYGKNDGNIYLAGRHA